MNLLLIICIFLKKKNRQNMYYCFIAFVYKTFIK